MAKGFKTFLDDRKMLVYMSQVIMKTFSLGHNLTLLALDAIVYAKVQGNYLGYHTTSHYKSEWLHS